MSLKMPGMKASYSGLLRRLVSIGFFLLLIVVSTINLESIPGLSWDEGWTLSVARHWIENGFYGRLLMGNHAPPGLEAHFPVTGPVALSFWFFGVGVWQGRLVGVLFLFGTVAIFYLMALRLYDRRVANLTVVALFLMAMFPQWHPVVMARQVLGETPMLFFLLSGFFCFYLALSRTLWFVPLAVLCWAIGTLTKAQAGPFWMASLLLPLVLTFYSRQWKFAILVFLGLVSSLLTANFISFLFQKLILAHQTLPSSGVSGIYGIMAFVPDLDVRLKALHVSLFLLPTILGLLYAGRESITISHWRSEKTDVEISRMMLLGFVGSWLAWYMFCSNGHPRHVFPASFAGSIFVAKLLRDLTDNEFRVFPWRKNGLSPTANFLNQHLHPELLLAASLIIFWAIPTMRMLHRVYVDEADQSAMEVANFMNTQTPRDAVIETYDSEVQFLLERRYHFPPDQIIVDLIQRAIVGHKRKVVIGYDPLVADPDYLVIGEFIKGLRLYDPVIRAGAFRFVRSFKEYDVYEREK